MREASDSYKNGKVYKHRYLSGRRDPPRRCPVIKRNGERCKLLCTAGLNCCFRHGGAAAKKNIKHGRYSKHTEEIEMRSLKSLKKEEREELLNNCEDMELIENMQMLTDAHLARVSQHQDELLKRRNQLLIIIETTSGKEYECIAKQIGDLDKEITNTSRIIQYYIAQFGATLKTKKDIKEHKDTDERLKELAGLANKQEAIDMVRELISGLLKSDPTLSLNDLALPVGKEYVDIPYEEMNDD